MKSRFATLVLAALALPSYAAEGVRTLPDTADAMAVYGGQLTIVDSPSVTRTNPAALTKIQQTEVQVAYQVYHQKTDFTNTLGVSESSLMPNKNLASAYMAVPINDTMTAGLGFSAPFGVSLNYPREGVFRYAGAYDATLQTLAINPALGLKINDKLSVGLGLDIFHSKFRLEQRYPWGPLLGASVPDGDAIFDGNGWGLGGYLGINYDIGERHHLVFTGRLPVHVDYEGDFDISNIPAPGLALPKTPFETGLEHPGSISIGYGYDVSERFRVGSDFNWIQNSAHDDAPLMIGANQPLLGGANSIPLDWDDSISVGFGAEYDLTESLVLRAGYQYADSPMNSRTYLPSIPADDRHTVSVGFGYEWGPNSIDFAYSKLIMANTDIRGNVQPAYNGVYKHDWDILTLSFTRRF